MYRASKHRYLVGYSDYLRMVDRNGAAAPQFIEAATVVPLRFESEIPADPRRREWAGAASLSNQKLRAK